jgi:glycosyltransferase involved in cell wall biosynthesis
MKREQSASGTSSERKISYKVAIIENTDFRDDLQGGVQIYARYLSHSLRELGTEVVCFGINISGRDPERGEEFITEGKVSNFRFLALLFKTAIRLRKDPPWIIHAQRPEQIVPFILTGKKNATLVCSMHGPSRTAVYRNKGRIVGTIYSMLELCGLIVSDSIIFTDSRTRKMYVERLPWLSAKSEVIPGGVSSIFFERKNENKIDLTRFGLNERDKVICYIGRLEKEKNVDLIIRAFSRIIESKNCYKLAIAGDGSLRQNLEQLVKELRLIGKALFLGQLSRNDIKDLLGRSEVLILASTWEGSPLVVREALASGAKVVSPDVGDVGELIRDDIFGQIVSEGSEKSIAEGILRVIEANSGRVPIVYSIEFSWAHIAKRMNEAYSNAVRKNLREELYGEPKNEE